MLFLTKKQIITINKLTIAHHGGNFVHPDNLLHEASLDYLVDAVYAELFGQQLYPTIFDKAGIYIFNIISNHILQMNK